MQTPLVAAFIFFTNSDCSFGVHWFVLGVVVELAMHVYLWGTKGIQLYMCPLIQQLRDKGIPLTAKALGSKTMMVGRVDISR